MTGDGLLHSISSAVNSHFRTIPMGFPIRFPLEIPFSWSSQVLTTPVSLTNRAEPMELLFAGRTRVVPELDGEGHTRQHWRTRPNDSRAAATRPCVKFTLSTC